MTSRGWYRLLAFAGFFGAGLMVGRGEWLVAVVCLCVGLVSTAELWRT